jgi:hypothetical protein
VSPSPGRGERERDEAERRRQGERDDTRRPTRQTWEDAGPAADDDPDPLGAFALELVGGGVAERHRLVGEGDDGAVAIPGGTTLLRG